MQLRDLTLPFLGMVILLTIFESERVTSPPQAPGPIHVAYWEKWTGFEGDAMQAVVDAFNRKQNKIHVDLLTVSGIQNKTLLAVAGGNPPDVAGLFGPNMSQYADNRAVLPLDDFCREKGITAADYIPVYWDMGMYQGHLYALPSVPASTALHYNKQMFRDAGLDPEKPPQTLDELDAMAAKITKLDPQGKFLTAGFLPAEPGWWNWGWGEIFGGRFWDGESKITADDPGNIEAMTWVQSYSKKYGAAKLQSFRSGFGNFSSPQNAFLSSKVAMELQGVWMYNFIDKYVNEPARKAGKPQLDWAAVPFPHPAAHPELAGHTFADEDILVIPRGAKHPKEAFEFIAFVQSQEGMELLCMGQKKHSPLSHVSPEFYAKHPNPYIKLFADMAKSKNAQAPPKIALWPEYQAELSNAFDAIALLHETPEEALKSVQARMQPKMDEYVTRLHKRQAMEGNHP